MWVVQSVNIAHDAMPDWASQMTAWSTLALALLTAVLCSGVVLAWWQLRQDRMFNRVTLATDVFKKWNKNRLWIARSRIDKWNDPWRNRARVKALYARAKRFGGFKNYNDMWTNIGNYLADMSMLTERMELYIARGAIDIDLVVDHIGYDIISTYFSLQDIYRERAATEDESAEGFRDLALRVQHHARLNPGAGDLRDTMLWAVFDILEYRGGDASEGYRMGRFGWFKRWRLKRARLKFMKSQ
jgi:hypothetical protein